jgi:succinate-acetate transporter protein
LCLRTHSEPVNGTWRAGSNWRTVGRLDARRPRAARTGGVRTTTFVLSIFNANLVNPKGTTVVLGLALAYGGIAQLLAGMWEFRTGNTFGAVAFSSFGGFWISFFVLLQLTPVAGTTGTAIAVYLYAWAIFTTYMFVASLRTTGAVALVFGLLAITFFLLAIGNAGGDKSILHLGGWFGIATAIAAWLRVIRGGHRRHLWSRRVAGDAAVPRTRALIGGRSSPMFILYSSGSTAEPRIRAQFTARARSVPRRVLLRRRRSPH